MNATRSYVMAGGSPNGASQAASLMIHRPKVRAAIEKWLDANSMTAGEATKRLSDFAHANIAPFVRYNERGEPELDLSREALAKHGHLIKEIETDPETGGVRKVKLHDAHAATRDVARLRQLFRDETNVNIAIQLQSLSDEEIKKRLRERQQNLRLAISAPTPTLPAKTEMIDAEIIEDESILEGVDIDQVISDLTRRNGKRKDQEGGAD